MKERLDVLLVRQGFAQSREKAKAILMAGNVFVNGQREDKAGTFFDDKVAIEVRGNTLRYVSRGGLKLDKAMEQFALNFAPDVTVPEPQRLREKVKNALKKALEKYE